MWRLALLLILPCMIAAETTCTGGQLSCPKGQTCCTVNNKQSCCDEAQLPLRPDLLSAASNSSVLNGLLAGCSSSTCGGTCCNSGIYGCCPYKGASCCANNKCCPMLSKCCRDGGCCSYDRDCCLYGCCPSNSKCCGNGCCPYITECCGGHCCPSNTKCCGGAWCCKRNDRCGLSLGACYGGAVSLSPTTLVTLVAAWLVAYAVKKL